MESKRQSDKTGSLFIPGLEEYINQKLIHRPHSIFSEIEEYAKSFHVPIVSPMAGAALGSWVKFHKPKSVLELGTGAGYSLHWILAYAESGIRVKTYERKEALLEDVKMIWDRSPYKNKANVEFSLGHILEEIERNALDLMSYDLVFVDSDKVTYPVVFDLWINSLRNQLDSDSDPRKTILFDNALWHGRLINPDPRKKSDEAMLILWEKVKSSGYHYELNPSGDGLLAVYSKD